MRKKEMFEVWQRVTFQRPGQENGSLVPNSLVVLEVQIRDEVAVLLHCFYKHTKARRCN
jgi:hypothetical protein